MVPRLMASVECYNAGLRYSGMVHRKTLLYTNSGRMRMYAIDCIAIHSVDDDDELKFLDC